MSGSNPEQAEDGPSNPLEAGSPTGAAGNQHREAGSGRRPDAPGAALLGGAEEETKSAEEYGASSSGNSTHSTADEAIVMRATGSVEPDSRSKKPSRGSKKGGRRGSPKKNADARSQRVRSPDNQREHRREDSWHAGRRADDHRGHPDSYDGYYPPPGWPPSRYREPWFYSPSHYPPEPGFHHQDRRYDRVEWYEDRRGRDRDDRGRRYDDRQRDRSRDRPEARESREPKAKKSSTKPAQRADKSANKASGAKAASKPATAAKNGEEAPQASQGAKESRVNPFHEPWPVIPELDLISGLSRVETTFVHECHGLWLSAGERVTPRRLSTPFAAHPGVLERQATLLKLIRSQKMRLRHLDVIHVGAPVQVQPLCYSVALGPLTPSEQVAILQTAFVDAGFSVRNAVPGIESYSPPFDEWSSLGPAIAEEVGQVREALEEWVALLESLKTASGPPRPTLEHAYEDPGAVGAKKASFSPVASQKPVPARVADPSDHDSDALSVALGERSPRKKKSEKPRPGQEATASKDPLAELESAMFFNKRGLGWRSDEGEPTPPPAPSPPRPKPPAFDDPMSGVQTQNDLHHQPATRSTLREPVFRAPATSTYHPANFGVLPSSGRLDRFGGSVPGGLPTYPKVQVANPVAPPSFVPPPKPIVHQSGPPRDPASTFRAPVYATAEVAQPPPPQRPVAAPAPQPAFASTVPQQPVYAPAPQQPAYVPVQQPPMLMYPRPFVPAGYLEPLTGEEPPEEQRQFVSDYELMAETAMWSDAEMCRNIYRYVKKPISTFIRQLGDRAKSWRTLKRSILDELDRSYESPMDRYVSLKQSKDETARHYLWRLNAAARRASVDLHDMKSLETHVTRFIRGLRDQGVKAAMMNAKVHSTDDLDEILRLYGLRAGKEQSDSHRSSSRDKEREYERDRRDRDRSSSRPRSSSTYYTYQDDYGGNEYARTPSDAEESGEGSTVSFNNQVEYIEPAADHESQVYRASGPGGPGQNRGQAKWSGSQQRPQHAKQNWPPQPAPTASTPPPGRSPQVPAVGAVPYRDAICYNCNQHGHYASDCPHPKPVCQHCAGPHPSESCWKKCPACSHVHAKPEDCAVVRAFEDLKSWYKSPAHAGNNPALPPSVLQHIDKPLN